MTETADLPEAPEAPEKPEELPTRRTPGPSPRRMSRRRRPNESDVTETADLPEAPEAAEQPEEAPDPEDSEAAGPAEPTVANVADREVAAEPGWRDRTVPSNAFDLSPLGDGDDRGDNDGAEGAGTQHSTSGGTPSATGELPATGGNACRRRP